LINIKYPADKAKVERNAVEGPVQTRIRAMEGAGAYNRHAKLQAAGVSLGLPLFAKAVENIPVLLVFR
jgi:hypothetical protein